MERRRRAVKGEWMTQMENERKPGAVSHIMRSDTVGDDFKISVSLPKKYDPAAKHPVVYLMDANIFFGLVAGTAHLLQFGDEIPQAIVVGVGYPDGADHLTLRNRDYCPTPYNLPEVAGGAADFLKFLCGELMPYIENAYSVDPSKTVLAGDSLSGLFGMYVLFHRPQAFAGYIIGSPSLYWDDRVTFSYEAQYAAHNDDLCANVFMSAGALEAVYEPAFAAMVGNVVEMEKVLRKRAYPSLKLKTHIFEDETHLSVIPATMSRGLRAVFEMMGEPGNS